MASDRGDDHSFADMNSFCHHSFPSLVQEYADFMLLSEATSAHENVTTYLFYLLPPGFAQENWLPLTSFEFFEKLIGKEKGKEERGHQACPMLLSVCLCPARTVSLRAWRIAAYGQLVSDERQCAVAAPVRLRSRGWTVGEVVEVLE